MHTGIQVSHLSDSNKTTVCRVDEYHVGREVLFNQTLSLGLGGELTPSHTIHTMHHRQSQDRVRGDLPTRIEAVSQQRYMPGNETKSVGHTPRVDPTLSVSIVSTVW